MTSAGPSNWDSVCLRGPAQSISRKSPSLVLSRCRKKCWWVRRPHCMAAIVWIWPSHCQFGEGQGLRSSRAVTGNPVWRHAVVREQANAADWGCRACPTVAHQRVRARRGGGPDASRYGPCDRRWLRKKAVRGCREACWPVLLRSAHG